VFIDLKFGAFGGWSSGEKIFPFVYEIIENSDGVSIRRQRASIGSIREEFVQLINRIEGI
jgi:hypothetical protein